MKRILQMLLHRTGGLLHPQHHIGQHAHCHQPDCTDDEFLFLLRDFTGKAMDGKADTHAQQREGLESVFFLIAVFGQSSDHKMPLGAVAGLATAVVIGVLLYQGGIRLNLGKFFRWTGVFLIFVAAGLLSGSFRALHEAGVWNIGQTILFDWSKVLHEDSPLGVLMGGFFGYTDHPTVSDIAWYFAYLLPALFWFLRGSKAVSPSR